jgi:mono/diheme cytochrome c family protein
VINGGRLMPAFKDVLTAKQIEAVARYVARNAGK